MREMIFRTLDEDTNSNEDDAMVHETQRKIVPMSKIKCRTRPYYINPKHSIYTRSRKYLLTSPSSITDLISSECFQKQCLKHMHYNCALEKRLEYL